MRAPAACVRMPARSRRLEHYTKQEGGVARGVQLVQYGERAGAAGEARKHWSPRLQTPDPTPAININKPMPGSSAAASRSIPPNIIRSAPEDQRTRGARSCVVSTVFRWQQTASKITTPGRKARYKVQPVHNHRYSPHPRPFSTTPPKIRAWPRPYTPTRRYIPFITPRGSF